MAFISRFEFKLCEKLKNSTSDGSKSKRFSQFLTELIIHAIQNGKKLLFIFQFFELIPVFIFHLITHFPPAILIFLPIDNDTRIYILSIYSSACLILLLGWFIC
jgi:hypothetical protein